MYRRRFLQGIGAIAVLSALSGINISCSTSKFSLNEKDRELLDELHRTRANEKRIYTELSEHVRLATYSGKTEDGKNKKIKGCGIILNSKYLTVAHISNSLEFSEVSLPFINVSLSLFEPLVSKEAALEGKLMEQIEINPEKDTAIYKVEGFPNFPCRPQTNYSMGDVVYIIGNPNLAGLVIRKGRIIDIDSFGDEELTSYCFGTDIPMSGGDSGAPCVSENFELLGLARSAHRNFSYVSKIENFLV